jgi:arylsulfate sulfotransferase
VFDRQRNPTTAAQPLTFITGAVPTNFPVLALLHSEPERMEPGYTLFRVEIGNAYVGYAIIVDSGGEVVWYGAVPAISDLRRLDNGDLFMPSTNNIYEINLLGDTVRIWKPPTAAPLNDHEALPTDHGTILYFSDVKMAVTGFPTSLTDPNSPPATATIDCQNVVEISATNAALLNTWSPVSVLDPRRISYLSSITGGVWDAEHSNALFDDTNDDSIIVSMRHQNAVVKISRATGQLRWILGPPENWGPAWQPYLLTPVGEPFVWQYGQHAATLTPQGTLLMFDNGNYRASPFATKLADTNNYSRAVEFQINEDTMEVSQVWEYGRTNVADRLYVDHEGNAELQPQTGNVLIDFAAVSYVNGVAPSKYGPGAYMVRLTEVTHDPVPEIVFDLAVSLYDNALSPTKICTAYRSHRIPDLYAHAALPVGDLTVSYNDGLPLLEFSADDTRTYVVEASADLVDWEPLGTAWEDEEISGNFAFEDFQPGPAPVRYYRVRTQ